MSTIQHPLSLSLYPNSLAHQISVLGKNTTLLFLTRSEGKNTHKLLTNATENKATYTGPNSVVRVRSGGVRAIFLGPKLTVRVRSAGA